MNTMQQEFDAVAAHLFKQGRPAKINGHCLYRTDEGMSCAVGCRIPDSVYVPKMENRAFEQLMERFVDVLPEEMKAYGDLYSRLQIVHDEWPSEPGPNDERVYDMGYLDEELQSIADSFNLTYKSPYEVK